MAEPSIVFTDVNERQGAFHRRIFVMGGIVAFGVTALIGRMGQLQIVQGAEYRMKSAANQFNFRLVAPPRGNILDRNGKLIAGNRPSFSVKIEANLVQNINDTLDQVSYILPQTVSARRRILRDINQNQRSVPTVIASDLNWEDFSRISLYANDIPGVVPDQDELRAYYYGGAFSHVVGYVTKASQKDLDREKDAPQSEQNLLHNPSFRIGKLGIERAYDKQLRGTAGGKKVEVNAQGQVVGEDPEGSVPPVAGQEIVLTIDADVQQRAVDLFAVEQDSGAAVMMDIHTGEIICMTSSPGFDPNLFVSGISSAAYKLYSDYDHKPLLDKAISSTFAPGSTFKTMVALAALENGYDPKTTHTCNGVFPFGNAVFKCDAHHGTLDLHNAIVTSCDVYFYQCALSMGGPDPVHAVATKFGLGQIFDIGIEGQRAGLVPTTQWKRDYFTKHKQPTNLKWYPGETPSFGIGQGYTHISALQNCVMMARVANGKKAVLPRLVKSIGGVDQVHAEEYADLTVNPANIELVHAALADVVASSRGTAAAAADMGLGPVKMAGKTGTAQFKAYKGGRGQHGRTGPWGGRDHAWFAAFAPADVPKYAIAVICEHGGFGSQGAAPKAREIMRTALLKDPEIQKRIVGTNILSAPPPMDENNDTGAAPPPPDEISTPASASNT